MAKLRLFGAWAAVALAAFYTPARALFCDHEPELAVLSLAVGVLFVLVAFGGRMRLLLRGASDKETLTATYRAKRILWIWAGFGGAVLVLALSTREGSSMDEPFGMIGFGWLVAGIAALLLESLAFSLEDALGECTSCSGR